MKSWCLPLALAVLTLGSGCGGSRESASQPAPVAATGLHYSDPTGNGWRLVKDPASTSTRLLLNLVGPAGLKSRGAGLNLKLPTGTRVGSFTEGAWPVRELGVYELWNVDPVGDGSVPAGLDPLEPRLIAGGLKPGNILSVGVFQKDRRASAKDSGQALFQVALEFDASSALRAGDVLNLSVLKARHIPEDIGAFSVSPTTEMLRKGAMVDMAVSVGGLTAQ